MSNTQAPSSSFGAMGDAFSTVNPNVQMPADYYLSSEYGSYGGYGGYSSMPAIGLSLPAVSIPNEITSPAPSTSSAPASSGHSLSLNLGGVNLNYDLGPSVDTLAAQAGQYLNNSFNADATLLGQTIVGANSLVTNLTTPLISAAQTQENVDNTTLPSFYNTLAGENYNLGLGSIAAAEQTANASIAASKSAASSAGGCYITAAVCDSFGWSDDCLTLRVLREFRDKVLVQHPFARKYVDEYYLTAPGLVEAINRRWFRKRYLRRLYRKFIAPAVIAICWNRFDEAFCIYRAMVETVKRENL